MFPQQLWTSRQPYKRNPSGALATMACMTVVFLFALAACQPAIPVAAVAAPRSASTTLTILHVTDFHGALLSEDAAGSGGRPAGGAAVLASYIRAEKAKAGGEVLLVAGGDMMQGSAVSNLSRGEAVIAFMNVLGFEACVVGNHEFDWGIGTLKERVEQADFPFLAANVFSGRSAARPPWLRPWVIVKKNGLKIGIIGVITEDTPIVANPKYLTGLRFARPDSIVNELVAKVRKRGADVVLVLSHLGGTQDRDGTVSGPVAAFASKLVGVDAVLDGHSHTVVSGLVNSIPVMISGSNGRRLGVMTLRITRGVRASLVEQSVKPTFAEEIQPDETTTVLVESYRKKFAAEIERVIAEAAEEIRGGRQESPFGSLVSDIMRGAVNAQIAFHNSGGIRSNLEKGPIKVREIFKALPFDNTIVTMFLTGEQVRQVLEEGTSSRGVVQVSGLRFACKQDDPPGQRVKLVFMEDGTPLSPSGRYFVATNDFMANGGDGFVTFKNGENIQNTQELLRDAVISWLQTENDAGRKVTAPAPGRIEVLQ
jgi:5'-nucleotidase/UDP-sugar diphosphatase